MCTVRDLVKGRPIYTVDAEQTVLEAATYMRDHNIGAIPVLRNGELAGIFSERDVMNRVVAGLRSPGLTKVAEVMTPRPRVVSGDDSLESCLFIMRELGFRHLPVMDGDKVEGLISLRDIRLRELSEKDAEVQQMRAHISDVPKAS